MVALTDFLENRILDWLLRGQTYTPPATVHVGLFTVSPAEGGGGTEVSGNGYGRVAVASSLANWSGTQGAGTTVASSGSSGTISNNNAINFATPTPSSWGTVVAVGLFDASTGGNLLAYAPLGTSVVTNTTAGPSFAAGTLQFQIDN